MEEKMTLSRLQQMIKEGIERCVPEPVWITAEIGEIGGNANGHCYLELVDYKEDGTGAAAKMRGTIWSSAYRILKPFFETATGSSLERGMHVLLKVQVQYSPVYGLSLNVTDIDPSFTVGEMELLRQRTLARLKSEGMFGMNASLPLPALPKKLAVVSSETAAGYRDFMKHLHENEYGFRFRTELFPAPVQGDGAPSGMIAALETIALRREVDPGVFDAVVLIRGGGSVLDLACFDDYELAVHIAQFPLPVLTGVGHDQDVHVCDMVAHTGLKTPTAVADFILDLFMQEEGYLSSLERRISLSLPLRTGICRNELDRIEERLGRAAKEWIRARERKIDEWEYRMKGLFPEEILGKGFGAVFSGDRRIVSVKELRDGMSLRLVLKDGVASFIAAELACGERS